jgi:hypothetical protein
LVAEHGRRSRLRAPRPVAKMPHIGIIRIDFTKN